MLLLLVLPVLVAGFIIQTKHPAYFYRLHRYDGQLLYLSSAYQGLICTLVATAAVFLSHKYFPDVLSILGLEIPISVGNWVRAMFAPIDNSSNLAWSILVTIVTLIAAYLRICGFRLKEQLKYGVFNRNRKEGPNLSPKTLSEIILIRSILDDSPLDSLFCDSFFSWSPEKYLMLTMEDGKVYVGKVISLGEPTESEGMDQEITITPFLSGYRTKERLKVIFTTKYNEIEDDIALVLRQDKIISATIFKQEVYEQFQKQSRPFESESE